LQCDLLDYNDNTGLLAIYDRKFEVVKIINRFTQLQEKTIKFKDAKLLKFNNSGLLAVVTFVNYVSYSYGAVALYNVLDGSLVFNSTFRKDPSDNILGVDFDNTGLLAIFFNVGYKSSFGQIELWNVKTRLLIETMSDKFRGRFLSVAFDNKGLVFAGIHGGAEYGADYRAGITVFEVSTGKQIDLLTKLMSDPFFLRFDPTGLLVSADSDAIRIWNTTNYTEIRDLRSSDHNYRSSIAIDNKGLVAYSAAEPYSSSLIKRKEFIHIYNYLTGALVSKFDTLRNNSYTNYLRFDNKGVLISASFDGLKFWKLSK